MNWFKENDTKEELVGERDSVAGLVLYLSHPIKITDPGCLACHGAPSDAPQTLLATYGSVNGFGWKLNEMIGAQIVTVPMAALHVASLLVVCLAEKAIFQLNILNN